jgi:hypothetical protein
MTSEPVGEQRGRLRRRLARLTAPQEKVHAEQEQADALRRGGSPVAEVVHRQQATVCGTLRSVTLRPRGHVPALVAELYDGTGSLSLVWLGRRQIAGIEPGRRVRARGLVTDVGADVVIYNPRYELVPAASHD